MNKKLTLQLLAGRPADSLLHHRRQLLQEVTQWILPSEKTSPDPYDPAFRDELIALLATESKQGVHEVPAEESEWTKLLNQWIKNNSADDIVFGRDIFRILAVDGFSGIRPKDFKVYLGKVLVPLRKVYRMHAKGVRAMYAFFDRNDRVESLTGTVAAHVVFLALLNLYAGRLVRELQDEHVTLRVHGIRKVVEGYLHKHSDYYRDIRHVEEDNVPATLAGLYTEQFTERAEWESVGRDMLKEVNGSLLQKWSAAKNAPPHP